MDTLIERKPGINRKRLYWVGGVMLGLAVIASVLRRVSVRCERLLSGM